MKFRGQVALAVACVFCSASALPAQFMSRKKGFGVRGSFWRTENNLGALRVASGRNPNVKLDLAGVGGSVYFFNRWAQRLYFETTIGAAGSVQIEASAIDNNNVDFSGLVSLLFGLRYDLLSPANESNFRPYISGGAGPYWLATGIVRDSTFVDKSVDVTSEFEVGTYLGSGLNFYLLDWFALNFDFKYHFTDLKSSQDFTGLEFGLGFNLSWGKPTDLFTVNETKIIVPDLYPAYYQFYSTYPIALVSVRNVAGFPIEINLRSTLKGYSASVYRSGYIRLRNRQVMDIPVKVILGKKFLQISKREPAALDIVIEARTDRRHQQHVSTPVIIHNRNGWDGQVDRLAFFVTPDDERILAMSRELARDLPDDLQPEHRNLELAQRLFDAMAGEGIRYQSDPNIPYYQDDRVQYAIETLDVRTGDCDDLVVLFSSLLESMGIKTAFVDVQDPDKDVAHLYLLFDTGVPPEFAASVSSNEKKYIVRENLNSRRTVWVPVETTLLESGFDAAWQTGALQYLQDGILRNGTAEGWVRIVEIQ